MPELLTIAQVAQRLGFSEFAIRAACKRGELASSKLLGQYRVSEDQLAAFVSAGEVAPEPAVARCRPRVVAVPSRSFPAAASFRARLRAREQG